MIAISSHLWNNLILIVHHTAADIHVSQCQQKPVSIRRLSKKIVGHSGAMTLTEKVYTHFDIKELVDAINKIQETIGAIRKSLRDFAHGALARYICHRICVCECKHSHPIFTSKCTACRNAQKRTFPSIATEKCPIHINIFVAYLLHMCCIRCKFQHI